jgi:hypothetical protein
VSRVAQLSQPCGRRRAGNQFLCDWASWSFRGALTKSQFKAQKSLFSVAPSPHHPPRGVLDTLYRPGLTIVQRSQA